MKTKTIIIIFFILAVSACVTKKPVVVSTPPADPCPMPSGYKLGPAVEKAEQTLMTCPNRLDQVFLRLVEIGKHSPDKENSVLIQDLLKRLENLNKISKVYAKNLYQKYFSYSFVSLPDVKVYNLKEEIDSIKKGLRAELALKKTGIVECSNDREGYKAVESEYARLVSFMDDLVLNEDYMNEAR